MAFGEASLAGFGVSPNPPIPQNVLGFCTRELGRERYQREAHECYDIFRIAWPREDAIKTPGKDHFGVK
ncbi:MAG: hypothetical protein E6J34_10355 [Chloroflexi bacterium]|nr:MAG: hypothetical protein E6J34_10355 [Chloroflexota bacterium]